MCVGYAFECAWGYVSLGAWGHDGKCCRVPPHGDTLSRCSQRKLLSPNCYSGGGVELLDLQLLPRLSSVLLADWARLSLPGFRLRLYWNRDEPDSLHGFRLGPWTCCFWTHCRFLDLVLCQVCRLICPSRGLGMDLPVSTFPPLISYY